jgi:IS30 family transposase
VIDARKRKEAKTLYALGSMTYDEIGRAVGCSWRSVFRFVKASPWPPRMRSERFLSLEEREEISRGLKARESLRSIAARLGRAPSTISREVNAQRSRSYRAWRGEDRADKLAARPKPKKLGLLPELRTKVEELLEQRWSPAQIARRLRLEYPGDPTMNVSHETIYKSLYVQGRGSLRRELAKHLRQGRSERRARSRHEKVGLLADMVNISQRPVEASDRAVPGHWEGDLIMGEQNHSAIGTLVERSTRYVMLLHLPQGRTAEHVREALTQKVKTLPSELWRSLTWDQGKELSQHRRFTVDTGVKVFFCDPHSPWQRGSNENTNGLLRQYFPKGTDLSQYSAEQLDAVARQLNGRPRQTLGWRTPAEKLDELLAKRAA